MTTARKITTEAVTTTPETETTMRDTLSTTTETLSTADVVVTEIKITIPREPIAFAEGLSSVTLISFRLAEDIFFGSI
jgi:hypothetical protein